MISRVLITIWQLVLWFIFRVWLKLTGWKGHGVITAEKNKRYVIAGNHADYRDPFYIVGSLPFSVARHLFPIRFMTAAVYYFSPLRPFAYIAGCFPTRSKKQRVPAGVNGAVQLLAQNNSILIFPEGKRTNRGEERAHSGLQRILAETDDSIGLILVKIVWEGPERRTIQLKNADDSKDKSSQEILDAIYQLPS